MKIEHLVEIDNENPFQNDKLQREAYADHLTELIANIEGSFVLSIDSQWGSGKTTFLRMWRTKLEKNPDFKTLYFNAWESDDSDDPLLSLLIDLESELTTEEEKSHFSKVMTYAKPLVKSSIPVAVKFLTHGLIDISKIDLKDYTEDSLLELTENIGSVEYDFNKLTKSHRNKLKRELEELQESSGKRIVFFIDELDRCRPSYAVETLERIKHLFSIPNFIFVLALDKNQLASSVCSLYGEKLDSLGYLRRFIDFEFKLPKPDASNYVDFKIETVLSSIELANDKEFWDLLKIWIHKEELSLREIDKLFNFLFLLLPITKYCSMKDEKLTPIYKYVLSVIYTTFIIMRFKDSMLFSKLLNKQYSVDEYEKYFMNIDESMHKGYSQYYEKIVRRTIELNLEYSSREDGDNLIGKDDFNGVFLNHFFDYKSKEHVCLKQIGFIQNFE